MIRPANKVRAHCSCTTRATTYEGTELAKHLARWLAGVTCPARCSRQRQRYPTSLGKRHDIPLLAAADADREPELLQHIFGCLSSVLRHLAQWLASDLPRALQQTARLRYHSARHVRQLAAQSMGFLLRHARGKALRAGVRTIYAGSSLSPILHFFAQLPEPFQVSALSTRLTRCQWHLKCASQWLGC